MSTRVAPKRVAILQSNYIPWKGYFDIINMVDEFVIYDSVQYTKRDWRNRNKIKTPNGTMWLSIPVVVRGKYTQNINEAQVLDQKWRSKHFNSFEHHYAKAAHYADYRDDLRRLYLETDDVYLSMINYRFMSAICAMLGIATRLSWSSDYALTADDPSERLLELCVQSGADTYLSGPSAKAYLNERIFQEQGVAIEYMDYTGYPDYPQLYPPFDPAVSVLDLILNTGHDAWRYMKSSASPDEDEGFG